MTRLCTLALLIAAFTMPAAAENNSPIDVRALQLLPDIDEPTRQRAIGTFRREHGKLARLYAAAGDVNKRLQKNRNDKKLLALRNDLAKKIDAQREYLLKQLTKSGITEAHRERLRSMPQGRVREQRLNHMLVLEAPGITERQRALLQPLVAAVNGSLIALNRSQERVSATFRKEDRNIGRQAVARIQEQFRQTEKRFWIVAYYVLTPGQMRAVRPRLAPRYRYIPQAREAMIQLPGITPSQGTRIYARYAEHESEIAADRASVRLLQIRSRDKKIVGEERKQLQQKLGATYRRMQSLTQDLRTACQEILTEEQTLALRALPPMLNIGERSRAPWDYTRGMVMHNLTREAIQKVQRTTSSQLRLAVQESRKAMQAMGMGAGMSELGPESPQSMGMAMMRQNERGRRTDILREAGAELMLDVLSLEQIQSWVIGE